MVRAILAGTKTQTRRAVKGTALDWLEQGFTPAFVADYQNRHCPYGQRGDRIWCRETFFAFGRWETRFSAKKGRDEWHFVDMTLETGHAYQYAAEGAEPALLALTRHGGVTPAWWKRPAIFMPRAASRITLEITGVRVERLQAITRGDAMAEGCPFQNMAAGLDPRDWYRELWNEINGPSSWDANPWVWVIEFRRVPAC